MFGSNRLIQEPSEEEMAERSLLMRLYHSRLAGDVYYPGEFVNGHAPELMRRGWIEEVGAGYRLTLEGVKGWAGMVSMFLRGPLNPATNELRAVLGMSVRTRLPKIHKRYLRRLVEAGGRLPADTFDERRMSRLRTQGYLFLIGDAWVEVTAAGRLVVEADPSPPTERGISPDVQGVQ